MERKAAMSSRKRCGTESMSPLYKLVASLLGYDAKRFPGVGYLT